MLYCRGQRQPHTDLARVRTHTLAKQVDRVCGTRNSSTKRSACFAMPFYRGCRFDFVSFGKRQSDTQFRRGPPSVNSRNGRSVSLR
jgi:hypothetical protein